MSLKTHNYEIEVTKWQSEGDITIKSTFIIKAVPVNEEQAMEIARILYPDYQILKVKIT